MSPYVAGHPATPPWPPQGNTCPEGEGSKPISLSQLAAGLPPPPVYRCSYRRLQILVIGFPDSMRLGQQRAQAPSIWGLGPEQPPRPLLLQVNSFGLSGAAEKVWLMAAG